jgi:UDP:flavonoid glycosyltransferase YjiC (YdhE family)
MSRHIMIPARGSCGDTQPCVVLGAYLRARGHRVGIVANSRYAALVNGAGLWTWVPNVIWRFFSDQPF